MAYSELELRIKTITELKKISAVMGVSKYSQKTVNELIHDILAIQDGTLQPIVMKRGRPKKEENESDIKNVESVNKDEVSESSDSKKLKLIETPKTTDVEQMSTAKLMRRSVVFDYNNEKAKEASNNYNYNAPELKPTEISLKEKNQSKNEKLKKSDSINEDVIEKKQSQPNYTGYNNPFIYTENKESENSQMNSYSEIEDDIDERKEIISDKASPSIIKKKINDIDKSARGMRSMDADMRDDIKNRKLKQNEEDVNNPDEESDVYFDAYGVVEIIPESFGYLRTLNYYPSDADLYVPLMQIKRFGLRNGDRLKVRARFFPNNKYASVIYIYEINGIPCDKLTYRPNFEDLVPVYPTERLRLEDGQHRFDIALRVIDLVSPIGRGQRGLIVSPPKAGKTTLLKSIAQAILRSYQDIEMIMLLVDERPEEVTDIKESVEGAEIVYSTFDMAPEHHTKVAELVMKRAKRSVELGKHVVILLDSITRLSRAYNQVTEQSGKTLTGGLDSAALFEPKKFFGAARSIKNGGSLTIIATALVDTGSKMDDIIYEEFKGTGNMEIHLSRKMSERRIFPAVDLNKSGTRREELLLTPKELEAMWIVRRALAKSDSSEAIEKILEMLMSTKTNLEFIEFLKSKK